ncbi:hypothetical protein [Alkalimonas amylolytica]|uniref:Uncharacterized protein n=1 Tax=Alkalimonas amylolytica TaxID=152573 RepID=A0A1H3YDR1_ALKAM|nr:hypothetical protein [Alkalimonas amylolytica]SEA09735.1 hypothetical protein SAMN04488051_101646 [Alkalimonas amylolytica]
MKKHYLLVAAIIGTVIVVLTLLYGRFAANGHGHIQPEQVLSNQAKSELGVNSSSSNALPDYVNDNAASKSTLQMHDTVSNGPDKMAYDDNWCIAVTDLNQQDIAYFQQELEDWNIARGRIIPAIHDGMGGMHLPDSSQYIAPYMEASYDAVWQQIKDDNEFAMVAALYRQDFDVESQRQIALRLVVKGHTSTALSHLVRIELVNAKTMYERASQVNKDAEQHLYQAMAYTVYGIKHSDLDAALSYLIIVSSADFPLELKPRYALGKNNRLNEFSDELEAYITKIRAQENLMLTTSGQQPKAVQHDFERRLARLHLEFGSELNDLKGVLPDTASTLLEGSECVQRQVTFFGDLERRARSSIK